VVTDAVVAGPADAPVEAFVPPTTIVTTSSEPWGPNCPRGGVRVQTALDLDGNRTIDSADETIGDHYLCNVFPVRVSLGPRHGCALASNGTVWCWGADDAGQLGDYGARAAYAPRPVAGVEFARALAVGGDFACVILPTTGVRCWGKSDRGQGGHGPARPFIAPSCVNRLDGALLGATSLALGGAHACAALDDGTVNCWGAGDAGQLGDGATADREWPVPVLGVAGARAVAAGGRHTCALLEDTTVRCWGAGDDGQLGDGAAATSLTPVVVTSPEGTAPLTGVTALAAGETFTCALLWDASVLCWGDNSDCQLGRAAATPRAPRPVLAPVRNVSSLAAGAGHACAVLGSGTAVCWGRNDFGQAGAPAGVCRAEPVELPLAHVSSVGAGRTHACVIDEVGLWCWGDASLGQLGIGVASASRSSHEPQLAIWPLTP